MKSIKLSIGTVEILESITWGVQEAIRSAMLEGFKVSALSDKEKQNLEMSPATLAKAKYTALELCVKKITLNDGKEVKYSKEWMDNLSIEDGDKLFDAVDAITNPISVKKK